MIALDPGFGIVEADLFALMFVMVRIGAALLAAPIFGAAGVPLQARIVATGAIAVFVLVHAPPVLPTEFTTVATFAALLGEAVIGLALGFVLQLAFAGPMIAGEQIAGGMGMAIATAIDPNTGSQSGALAQYFTIVLTLVFLGVGGHLLWLRLVIESYAVFPPGDWPGGERMALVAGFASEAFATAVLIALPVLMALFTVQLITGIISRSAPSLNLFALGLPAGVLAGLAALIAAFPLFTERFVALSLRAVEQAGQVVAG